MDCQECTAWSRAVLWLLFSLLLLLWSTLPLSLLNSKAVVNAGLGNASSTSCRNAHVAPKWPYGAVSSSLARFTTGPFWRRWTRHIVSVLCLLQASLFGTQDGKGLSVVYYFALPEGWEPADVPNSAALEMLQRFFHDGKEQDK